MIINKKSNLKINDLINFDEAKELLNWEPTVDLRSWIKKFST